MSCYNKGNTTPTEIQQKGVFEMKGLRRLLLVAAATAGLALSLTGCSKTVDFLQYADVTFDGINGQATATVNVDYNLSLIHI